MEILIGIFGYIFLRCVVAGFYTIDQNERAVKTILGRADRLNDRTTSQEVFSEPLTEEEKLRYSYPILKVIGPGLHFKLPWEKIFKVSIATETMNMAFDPESPRANHDGTVLEAVTRDQLNIGLKGQIRFRVSERNLYAYFFGIRNPIAHVMGYFVSILREKIANFEGQTSLKKEISPEAQAQEIHVTETVSVNDLRKNLRDINDILVQECQVSEARYGMILDASLITGIEPPQEVDSALAAINTAYNNVSSEISLAKASADQTIVQSRRAVEIETLKAQAEVEPLLALSTQMRELKNSGPGVLSSFVRNVKLNTFKVAKKIVIERSEGRS
jgi:regulator of protease activity HflC (stomatin/prohibitin superfamily)